MKTVTNELLNNEDYLLYIHTPFCGTCHLAKTILTQIESAHQQDLFYEMNASLFPDFMQEMYGVITESEEIINQIEDLSEEREKNVEKKDLFNLRME